MEIVIAAIIGLILGSTGIFLFKKTQDEKLKKSARIEADRILNKARAEAAKLKKDSETRSKDFEARARRNVEAEIHKQKQSLKNKESQLDRRLKELDDQGKQRGEEHDRQMNNLKDREQKLQIAENRNKDLEKKVEGQIQDFRLKIESVAAMSQEEAKRQLLSAMEDEAKKDGIKRIAQIEEETTREADRQAKRIISNALARFASEYTSERTVSVLALPSDEMKGKIIGREGRNIRTLEALCGVDLIVDDTPEAVVISGFDPIRRTLARRTIEKLMEDGRVHPARIEEVVEKQRTELMKSIKEEGDRVAVDLGITHIHPELLKLVGGLKFRSTHAQNALNHCLEVAHLSGLIAAEIGLNIKVAKRAGLLHDIGLAIEHTVEGSHSMIGADWAKKYGETDEVCHAIRSHHDDEKPSSSLAWVVHTANILSNSRPGARRPHMNSFIHRLEDLESIGNSFEGVLRSYALQAGKEVRVMVESSKVTDDLALLLSRDIARKIEREMPQVGQVRVSVVRETRSVEHAR